jgi:DNA repair protein RadA/Sms
MARAKTCYSCDCGATTPKWQGQCPGCGAWNTLIETIAEATGAAGNRYANVAGSPATMRRLSDIKPSADDRIVTRIEEFDRVLGGGLVSGGVVLLGGDPGIGKSTLLLQVLAALANSHRCLYVCGEESGEQVALRARRLQIEESPLDFLAEVNLERILSTLAAESARVVVIDSIQTIYSEALTSAPGSVTQVRECAAQLTRFAKATGTCMVFVGHVTKEGTVAGPRVLEHIVDTVLYFEGDPNSNFRLIRAQKNRFGAVNELGVLAMLEKGLKSVPNPSALFLSQHQNPVAGSCVMATQEGTRPLLVEIQSLVDEAHSVSPRRLCVGLDQARLAMLLAVFHRHASIACFSDDVFVNAVGGIKITEPAADLAVLLALFSSIKDKALPQGLVVFGEVGLAGEVRPTPRGQDRLKEAAKLGFTLAIVPAANVPKHNLGIHVIGVSRIEEALQKVRELEEVP